MRVLVVSNGYPPRGRFGTEFYTRELVRALLAAGDEVSVLHPDRSGGSPRYEVRRVVEEGVPVALLSNPGRRGGPFAESYADERVDAAFAEHLARVRPDVCHFTYLLWGLSVRLPRVAAVAGVPSVLTATDHGLACHRGQMFDARLARCFGPHPPEVCARCVRTPTAHDLAPPARAAKRLVAEGLAALGGLGLVPVAADLALREAEVRATLDALARVVAPTRAVALGLEALGLPPGRVVRLPYAFDEAPYHALRGGAAPRPARFGFLGQLAPHKDPLTLLAAGEELARRRPDAEFEVVLHGEPAGHRAVRYGDRVRAALRSPRARLGEPFAPEEAPRVLAGLSALVLPSLWDENAPLSLLQARAAGVPVLASDVPGIAEVIPAEPHGRLFPPGDAGALSSAMEAVIDGRIVRDPAGALPVSLAEHVARVRELHASAREEAG